MGKREGVKQESEYDDRYLKIVDDPTYWLVEGGERQKMHSMEELYEHGLKQIMVVGQDVLDAIPIRGAE